MKRSIAILSALLLITLISCSDKRKDGQTEEKGILLTAYIDGNKEINTEKIIAGKITHVYYREAKTQDGKILLDNEDNLKKLIALKNQKEGLKVLLSVRIDNLNTIPSTEGLPLSMSETIKKYKLDGIEIDCTFAPPVKKEEIDPDSKQKYTQLLSAIKSELEILGGKSRKYLLAVAMGVDQDFKDNTEMDKAAAFVDYINIKAYDYQSDKIAVHQSSLYASGKETQDSNINNVVVDLIKSGIPAKKLMMGISFYGKTYLIKKGSRHGLGDPIVGTDKEIGYTELKDKYVNQNEFYRYWENLSSVPYLYNFYKQIFITYDDEESVKSKCSFVENNHMGGIIIKGLEADTKSYLIKEINPFIK